MSDSHNSFFNLHILKKAKYNAIYKMKKISIFYSFIQNFYSKLSSIICPNTRQYMYCNSNCHHKFIYMLLANSINPVYMLYNCSYNTSKCHSPVDVSGPIFSSFYSFSNKNLNLSTIFNQWFSFLTILKLFLILFFTIWIWII